MFVWLFPRHGLSGYANMFILILSGIPLHARVVEPSAAEMMDHIIRLEESHDNQQLDLQFTASFVYGPLLHEQR